MTAKPKLLKNISMRAIAPSVVTLMAFCLGITSIRFALAGQWEMAIAAIFLAGIFDGLDGTVARLLKSTSRFGAELDSLSDIVSFGVSPAVVLYLWTLQSLDKLGWAIALVYAAGMALRLARFNAHIDEDDEPKKKMGFLTGVPAPMGAGLLAMPMLVDFILMTDFAQSSPYIVAVYVVFVTLLMVSSLPTPSLKGLKIAKDAFIPTMLFIVVLIGTLFVYPWPALFAIGVIYYAFLPVCIVKYRKIVKARNS
ncbi:CDP-diacylglycerol--serine O-phosphatidyltransferase [Temperatibacter marinus]|uniref:CDP-diacylglycerol--serine O-phosphatidyltransferase n=1 Tax=Temperatibacter marinus TaxID=1456591 RepID=A0AA52EH00_9PROT|nr:CDP-diacylglycerol--serine O-phosphatidyltransferase [Temperatibacter marinus]WND02159.1 CDP-diacylglycerol--serine O-phosphatidyltransferase [Temperatibacter marinus]